MKQFAILVDSTIKLDEQIHEKYEIFIVPLSINFQNVSYKEKGNLEELTEEIFDKINEKKEIPKTSQPSVQDFLDIFSEIDQKGYKKILGFFLSSNLSGTFQGALNAKKIFLENNNLDIRLFDTHSVAQIAGLPIKKILNKFELNIQIEDDEINDIFIQYSENTTTFLLVSSLNYLSMGGRISSSVAAIGNLFGVTPILSVKDGVIEEFEKCRSLKSAHKRIFELLEKDFKQFPDDSFIGGIIPVHGSKKSHKILHQLEKIARNSDKELEKVSSFELTPVISSHTGPNSLGIFWTKVNHK